MAVGTTVEGQRAQRHAHAPRTGRVLWPYAALIGAFALSRLIYYAAGVRYDMWPFGHDGFVYPWQLLDPALLQHHLVSSLWHLDAQPPLYNAYVGMLFKLPPSARQPVAVVTYLILGLAMVLSVFATMVELGVSRGISFVVTLMVVVDPSYILYENWLAYAYPTAALLSVAALCLVRFVRTCQTWWGVGFFSSIALVGLLNSTYQFPWLIAAFLIVLVGLWSRWRTVVVAAFVPLLLVGLWLAKDVRRQDSLRPARGWG